MEFQLPPKPRPRLPPKPHPRLRHTHSQGVMPIHTGNSASRDPAPQSRRAGRPPARLLRIVSEEPYPQWNSVDSGSGNSPSRDPAPHPAPHSRLTGRPPAARLLRLMSEEVYPRRSNGDCEFCTLTASTSLVSPKKSRA